jgi:hypothetical protein
VHIAGFLVRISLVRAHSITRSPANCADTDARPAWNKGDFFGTKFGKK